MVYSWLYAKNLLLRYLCWCLVLVSSQTICAQQFAQALDHYNGHVPVEKIYVSHDRPNYRLGDTIWCNAFMLEGHSLQPFDGEPLINVRWIAPGGQVLQEHTLKVKNGMSAFQFFTYSDDIAGSYDLVAYSHYQLNFEPSYIFRKSIQVGAKTDDKTDQTSAEPLVQFFPEGGSLITNLSSKVLVWSGMGEGQPRQGSITILRNSKPFKTISSNRLGFASIDLEPKPDEDYEAVITHDGENYNFPFPKAQSSGLALRIAEDGSHYFKCSMSSTSDLSNCTLVGHVQGQVFLEYSCQNQPTIDLKIDRRDLPSGLMHFTIFDAQDQPHAERLVFNLKGEDADQVALEIDSSHADYSIRISSSQDSAIASISIYQQSLVVKPASTDICSYLWLHSELNSSLPKPSLLDSSTLNDMNELMIAYGWSRFEWPDVLDGSLPTLVMVQRETQTLIGRTLNPRTDEPVAADLTVSIFHDSTLQLLKISSSEEGLFYLENLNFPDSTTMLINASIPWSNEKKKRKPRSAKVEQIELYTSADVDSVVSQSASASSIRPVIEESIELSEEIYYDSTLWSIDLEGVTVRARQNLAQQRAARIKKRYQEKGFFFIPNTPKFIMEEQFADSKFGDMLSLIRTVFPRAKIVREAGIPKIIYGRLSSGAEATIVVDGFVRNVDQLLGIDPYTIEIAEYLDALRAAAMGFGKQQTLFFSTKDGDPNGESNSLAMNYPGYYQAIRHRSKGCSPSASDFTNRTLHWYTGKISTEEKREFTYCPTSEAIRTYVHVEGVTDLGVPFSHFRELPNRLP